MTNYKNIHILLPDDIYELLKSQARAYNLTITDYIKLLIKYRNENEIELANLKEQLNKEELKVNQLKALIKEKEKQIEEQKKSEEIKKYNDKYALTSFWLLYNTLYDNSIRKINLSDSMIADIYGISFNVSKCNTNFDKIKELSNDEIANLIELKKLDNKAKRDAEIVEIMNYKG